jgi:hypothetical protein
MINAVAFVVGAVLAFAWWMNRPAYAYTTAHGLRVRFRHPAPCFTRAQVEHVTESLLMALVELGLVSIDPQRPSSLLGRARVTFTPAGKRGERGVAPKGRNSFEVWNAADTPLLGTAFVACCAARIAINAGHGTGAFESDERWSRAVEVVTMGTRPRTRASRLEVDHGQA